MNNLVSSPDSSKRYKHDVIDKKDVIGELPDSLLHHILSFLSTRDAIRTSLLRRRWKFLWTYLSDFNIKVEDRQKQIIHLFNQVDTILEKAKFIKRFSLAAYEDVDVEKVYWWTITLLLKHKIQELELSLNLRSTFLLAKCLVLSKYALSTLSHAENLLSRLPTFHNLTHLGVDREMYDFTGEALMDILEKSPKLEVLDIVDGFDPDFCSDGEVWTLRPVPHCIKYSLKLVRITDFWGRVAEMQFLIFMLKNATILRRMKIFCGESLSADLKKQGEINNQLQVTRKGLPSCAIEFR
ncbi:hypothetical protein K1719_011785 [Acacia pycnantha]|nr:hypothetical protein K1719_011785 [Acacia pycnantha]